MRPFAIPLARPTHVCLAALLALGSFGAVQADGGDEETIGVARSVVLPAQARGNPPSWAGQAYRQGVVTAANRYGAQAGAAILEQGGNAIDAAVAIAYALNVVEPQSAGIGGGGFMMIHDAATGKTITIDSREKAPAAATPNMFVGVTRPDLNGVAVGVPGMVRGTALALEKYGRLTLAQVLQPAIKLADEGFAATPRYTAVSCNNGGRSTNSPEAAAFFCPGGQPVPVGSLVQNKPLAETFKLIAANGPDCFYKFMPDKGCDIAQGIVEGQKFNRPQVPGGKGGSMTLKDLEDYQPAVREPIEGTYRGYRIKSMAPPSSGALTVLQILNMLERFPIGDASQGFGFAAPNTLGVMADAMRIAFADRRDWMADADFVKVPSKGLLDATYLGTRGAAIVPGVRLTPNPDSGDPRPYEDTALKEVPATNVARAPEGLENGTTHFSVVDKWGNMVSYTNTIESSHGIGVFAGYKRADGSFRSHGFLLNNELTDFNTTPGFNPRTNPPEAAYNDVQPNKRPRSSMAPTMLFSPDGKPIVAYGSPGGATIINSVVNVTLNLVDHKMTLQEAIDAPRLSASGVTSSLTVDPSMPQASVDALLGRGYTVARADVGSVQAVLVDMRTGKQYGGADRRREGTVIGLPGGQ
jgi:gamma-glutamyltranspeptidase/glutathione hydrolase